MKTWSGTLYCISADTYLCNFGHNFIFLTDPFTFNIDLTTRSLAIIQATFELPGVERPSRKYPGGGAGANIWRGGGAERGREYKDRGVGGRLSGEMRAPPAPCRGWVDCDISNLLKLIASQTLSSLPSPSVVKPMPRLWRVMMNGLNVKDLKPSSDPP